LFVVARNLFVIRGDKNTARTSYLILVFEVAMAVGENLAAVVVKCASILVVVDEVVAQMGITYGTPRGSQRALQKNHCFGVAVPHT